MTDIIKTVDALGRVKAKIADLEAEEKRLTDELRAMGPGSFEGRLFRATVGEDGTQWRRDTRALRDKLWELGYYAFVKAHEQEVPRAGAVRIVTRTGQELGRAA